MNDHVFATIRFPTRVTAAHVKAVNAVIFDIKQRKQSAYASFEQKGHVPSLEGAAPHVHLVVLNIKSQNAYKDLERSLHTAFKGFTKDIHIERTNNYHAKMLVTSFLKYMTKKGRSEGEKRVTRMWRERLNLPASIRVGDVVDEIYALRM